MLSIDLWFATAMSKFSKSPEVAALPCKRKHDQNGISDRLLPSTDVKIQSDAHLGFSESRRMSRDKI